MVLVSVCSIQSGTSSKKVAEEYKYSVNEEFLFTIKVPNSLTLTHFYRKNKTDYLEKNPFFLSSDLYEQFIDSIKPLHNQIACLIFQFEYLNKEKMESQSLFQNLFHNFITKIPDLRIPIGIEIRNPNYLNKKFFEFIEQLKLIPVLLEGYYMPSVFETCNKFKTNFIQTVVFRLHGPDRTGIEKLSNENWNQIYIDRTKELEKLSELFKDLLNHKLDIFINVNNHFEGSAPLTIQKLKKLIKV